VSPDGQPHESAQTSDSPSLAGVSQVEPRCPYRDELGHRLAYRTRDASKPMSKMRSSLPDCASGFGRRRSAKASSPSAASAYRFSNRFTGSTTTTSHTETTLCAYANDAASETDDNPPIAYVVDDAFNAVHEGRSYR
jgi:hypothetical protein